MEELTDKEFKRCFRFLTREFISKGIETQEAMDIASDTIRKASMTHDPTRGAFSTHLFNVKKTMVIDFFRSKRLKMSRVTRSIHTDNNQDDNYSSFNVIDNLNILENDQNIDTEMDQKIIYKVLMLSFKLLKPLEKDLMYDFYFKELKYKELVKKYNIPLGTVKGTLFRSKNKLQEILKNNTTIKDFMNM